MKNMYHSMINKLIEILGRLKSLESSLVSFLCHEMYSTLSSGIPTFFIMSLKVMSNILRHYQKLLFSYLIDDSWNSSNFMNHQNLLQVLKKIFRYFFILRINELKIEYLENISTWGAVWVFNLTGRKKKNVLWQKVRICWGKGGSRS